MGKQFDDDSAPRSLRTDDTDYLKHFRSTYRFQGRPFESYLSAYHYAERRGNDFNGKDWPEVEEEFQDDWEKSYPGTWPRFREAIYYGWQKNHRSG